MINVGRPQHPSLLVTWHTDRYSAILISNRNTCPQYIRKNNLDNFTCDTLCYLAAITGKAEHVQHVDCIIGRSSSNSLETTYIILIKCHIISPANVTSTASGLVLQGENKIRRRMRHKENTAINCSIAYHWDNKNMINLSLIPKTK